MKKKISLAYPTYGYVSADRFLAQFKKREEKEEVPRKTFLDKIFHRV
jgi:hypothetical protein